MQTLSTVWHIVWILVLIGFGVILVEILFQGKRHWFLRRDHDENKNWGTRMKTRLEELKKCLKMLMRPIPKVIGVVIFWRVLYANGLYFTERFEMIATAAWIVVIGVLYSLIYSKEMEICFNRLQKLRNACRMPDWLQSVEASRLTQQERGIELTKALSTYVLMIDDNLSPALRALVIVPSLLLVGSFMVLKYPDALSGGCCMATISYLLCMFYMVLMEVDNVSGGLYHTRIPPKWKSLNVKAIRKDLRDKEQEHFERHTSSWPPHLKTPTSG